MAETFDGHMYRARSLLSRYESSTELWEANGELNAALTLRPTAPRAWLLKAQTLAALEDLHAALACAEMASRGAPEDAECHYVHATILGELGRLPEALRALDRASETLHEPASGLLEDIYYERASILDAQGRVEEAIKVFEEGLRLLPESSLLAEALAPLRKGHLRDRFRVIEGGQGE